MAWLSPALAISDVQKRFVSVTTNAIPPEVVTTAIDDAENIIRPFIEAVWGTGATTNGTVRALTIHLAAAFVYRSAWGMKAFGTEAAAQAADGLEKWVFEKIEALKESGELTGAARVAAGVTNADETSGVRSLGYLGDVEPTDTIEADATERRTF